MVGSPDIQLRRRLDPVLGENLGDVFHRKRCLIIVLQRRPASSTDRHDGLDPAACEGFDVFAPQIVDERRLPGPYQRRAATDLIVGDDHPDAVALHNLHSVERGLWHPAVEHTPDKESDLAAEGTVWLDHLWHLLKERRPCPCNAPPCLLHQRRHLLVAGQGQPTPVRNLPELLDRFARDVDLLRADLQAPSAGCAVEESFLDGIFDPVHRVSGIEGEAHLLPEHRRPGKFGHLECRTGRYAAETLDTVPEWLYRFDLFPRRDLHVRGRAYPGDLCYHRPHIHHKVLQDREIQGLDRHTVASLLHAGKDGCPVHPDGAAPTLSRPATVAVGECRVVVIMHRVESVEHPGALVDPDRVLLKVGSGVLGRIVAGDPESEFFHAVTPRCSIPSRTSET